MSVRRPSSPSTTTRGHAPAHVIAATVRSSTTSPSCPRSPSHVLSLTPDTHTPPRDVLLRALRPPNLPSRLLARAPRRRPPTPFAVNTSSGPRRLPPTRRKTTPRLRARPRRVHLRVHRSPSPHPRTTRTVPRPLTSDAYFNTTNEFIPTPTTTHTRLRSPPTFTINDGATHQQEIHERQSPATTEAEHRATASSRRDARRTPRGGTRTACRQNQQRAGRAGTPPRSPSRTNPEHAARDGNREEYARISEADGRSDRDGRREGEGSTRRAGCRDAKRINPGGEAAPRPESSRRGGRGGEAQVQGIGPHQ